MLDLLTMTYRGDGQRRAVEAIWMPLGYAGSLVEFSLADEDHLIGAASNWWPWPWDDAIFLIERGEFPLDRERW